MLKPERGGGARASTPLEIEKRGGRKPAREGGKVVSEDGGSREASEGRTNEHKSRKRESQHKPNMDK